MATDYYLILGLTPDAGAHQIKRAYLSLSRRYDPDSAGEAGEPRLGAIREAYETLSDPARRADYHRQLVQDQPPLGHAPSYGTHLWPQPLDLFSAFASYNPSREAMFDAFTHGMTGRGIPKSHRIGEINLEVVLSPSEAAQGGHLPIDIPVARLCARCDGTGRTGFFHCDGCDAHGIIWSQARVELPVPRETRDGTTVPVSLQHLGVDPMGLNVHLRVSSAVA